MSANTIIRLTSAALLGATVIGTGTTAMAAPMGITPKAAVAVDAPVTDVQYRRWGGRGYYRRGWGGPGPVVAGAALGILGAAAAASAAPYYYGGGYPAYGYGYAAPAYGYYRPSPYYYGY